MHLRHLTAVILLAGCPSGGTATTTSDCPAVPQPYPAACVETTAAPPEATGYTTPFVAEGGGIVLEAGSDLALVPGSAPITGFDACTSDQTHQVRLLDDAGETWTFGWDLEGEIDDDSLAAVEDGERLDYYAAWQFFGYSSGGAVLLSDDAGPLFLLELGYATLDEAERGYSVDGTGNTCTRDVDGRELEFTQLTFTWTDGSADLWAGQSVTIPYSGRSVRVLLGDESYLTGCLDGCSASWQAGIPER